MAARLEQRWDRGDHWWELRPCDYYAAFDRPKIIYPDIAKEPRFVLDDNGLYVNNTTYVIAVRDLYLLGLLNSRTMWDYAKQRLSVLGDADNGGRLRFFQQFVRTLPIPNASNRDRVAISSLVQKCIDAKGVGCEKWKKKSTSTSQVFMGFSLITMQAADASLERSLDSDELLGPTESHPRPLRRGIFLKRLFWEVLSYDRVREALPLSFLPASLESQITHLEVFAESQSLTVLYAISMTGLDRTRIEHMAWSLKRRIPTCLILLFDQQRWLISTRMNEPNHGQGATSAWESSRPYRDRRSLVAWSAVDSLSGEPLELSK